MQSADWMDQQKLSLLKYMNYWLRDRVSWLMLCKTWMAGILDPNNNILFPPFTSSFFFWVFCVHYLWVLFKKMNIFVTSLPYCVNLYILTWSFKVFSVYMECRQHILFSIWIINTYHTIKCSNTPHIPSSPIHQNDRNLNYCQMQYHPISKSEPDINTLSTFYQVICLILHLFSSLSRFS